VRDGNGILPTPVLVVIGGAIGAVIGSSGGRNGVGFVAGLVLGAGLGGLASLVGRGKGD
jgi:hypothetical protein